MIQCCVLSELMVAMRRQCCVGPVYSHLFLLISIHYLHFPWHDLQKFAMIFLFGWNSSLNIENSAYFFTFFFLHYPLLLCSCLHSFLCMPTIVLYLQSYICLFIPHCLHIVYFISYILPYVCHFICSSLICFRNDHMHRSFKIKFFFSLWAKILSLNLWLKQKKKNSYKIWLYENFHRHGHMKFF